MFQPLDHLCCPPLCLSQMQYKCCPLNALQVLYFQTPLSIAEASMQDGQVLHGRHRTQCKDPSLLIYVKATAGLKGKSTCSGLNTSLVTARWLPHWRLPLHIAAQRETREKGATRSPPHHHRKYQSRDRSAAARLPSAALRPCVPLRRRSAAGGKTTSFLPPSPWRGSACSSRQPRANGQMDGRTAPGGGAAAPGADPRRTRSEGTQRPPFRDRQWLGLSPSLARNEAALGGRGGAERWGQGAVLTSRLQHRHGGLCLSQEHRPPGRLPSAAGRHRGCAQCFAAAGSGVFLASVSAYAFCAFISNVALWSFGFATGELNKVHLCGSCLQKAVGVAFSPAVLTSVVFVGARL